MTYYAAFLTGHEVHASKGGHDGPTSHAQ
jgi:hypothetical protein